MSSRVRQGEPPGRSRPRRIAKLNATPTSNERLNFRLTFLSFVYFGKRPRFPPPRKVSVVRREQIRVLNQNRHTNCCGKCRGVRALGCRLDIPTPTPKLPRGQTAAGTVPESARQKAGRTAAVPRGRRASARKIRALARNCYGTVPRICQTAAFTRCRQLVDNLSASGQKKRGP